MLYSDGSASYGSGLITFEADGSAMFGGGRFKINADGSIVVNGTHSANSGSIDVGSSTMYFANGLIVDIS